MGMRLLLLTWLKCIPSLYTWLSDLSCPMDIPEGFWLPVFLVGSGLWWSSLELGFCAKGEALVAMVWRSWLCPMAQQSGLHRLCCPRWPHFALQPLRRVADLLGTVSCLSLLSAQVSPWALGSTGVAWEFV